MAEPLIVQHPAQPQQLLLLFHGFGAGPEDLLPLAQRLAQAFPQAFVASVAGPQPSSIGSGRQWFDVHGMDDTNRCARIEGAAPGFAEAVRAWQARAGVGPDRTALIGFSQGAAMVLETTRAAEPLATRVVAIAGRYAALPETAPRDTTVHLLHGKHDAVIPYRHSVAAAERLVALGGDVTADVVPFVGHEINAALWDLLVQRLTTYVPKRLWDEALRNVPATGDTSPNGAGG